MSADMMNDQVMALLAKSLDAYSLRHKVISNNIANVNTPGFKRSYVSFESQLAQIVGDRNAKGRAEALASFQPAVEVDAATTTRYDGNNVNVDSEMADLAENTLSYTLTSQLLKTKLSMFRHVISEGRLT